MHDEWGITDGYHDIDGTWHTTSEESRRRLRDAMGTPLSEPPIWFVGQGQSPALWNRCSLRLEDGTDLGEIYALAPDLPSGYHELSPVDGSPPTLLVVHPEQCRKIPRKWGVAAQIYALWTARSWGIGDYHDLAMLATRLQHAGGGAMLLSPLYQPAPSLPQENSPYYPSSRRARSALLLGCDDPPPPVLRCSPNTLIDRDAVWPAKREWLEQRYATSRDLPPLPSTTALWNALCDEFGPEWTEWPLDVRYHDPELLARRLRENATFAQRATFHEWCQVQIRKQLADVRSRGVDLIGDFAVGFSPQGADAWEYQDLLALDMRVGAPPDPFNEEGQDWGIPPFIPWRLRNVRYKPFIESVRASLRGCDGLRIDHVMGMFRQFWLPAGALPSEGAYVWYPADELLAIICLEAERAGAYVVGEDLGTVEDRVRDALATRHIAGTRVMLFEDTPPTEWPEESLATVTTHDLPTIAGLWTETDGSDDQRTRLSAMADADSTAAVIERAHDVLLRSSAALRLLSLDDICAAELRPNQPGTLGPPNWCRRLPLPVDEIEFPTAPDEQLTAVDSSG